MFKTFISICVTLVRLGVTLSLLLLVGVLTMFFKWYANNGETTVAICCLVTSLATVGLIYLIWRKTK